MNDKVEGAEVRQSLPTRTIWPVGVRRQKKAPYLIVLLGHNGALTEFSLLRCVCVPVCARSFAGVGLCAQACGAHAL